MSGKDYSQQAYYICQQFEALVSSSEEGWKDEHGKKFGYDHVEPIRKALSDMQLSIECVVDVLDSKLNEIRGIASGR